MEIVGAEIGGSITNNPGIIKEAIGNKTVIKLLDRRYMQLMAATNSGPEWRRFAESPTLFEVDENMVESVKNFLKKQG